MNTHLAGAAAMLVWLLLEKVREGHPTVLGGVTGAVAGLATITPAAGYVDTLSAILIGVLAAAICHLALRAKFFFRFDDALDVIAVHFIGGVLGSLLLGLFGDRSVNTIGADGLFYGGGLTLLGWQAVALISVVAFSFCATWLIAVVIHKTMGLRVDPADEDSLDTAQQGMEAYHVSRALGLGAEPVALAPVRTVTEPPMRDGAATAELALVTALLDLDSTRIAELKHALIEAGASTIVASEAHVYVGDVHETTVRNHARSTDIVEQLRIEVLVSRERLGDVESAFQQFSTGPRHQFTHPVETSGG